MSIEAVLEGVNRGGVHDMLRKTVPRTDHTLTEEVFPEVETWRDAPARPSDRPPVPRLQFSRNRKAIEASNIVETGA